MRDLRYDRHVCELATFQLIGNHILDVEDLISKFLLDLPVVHDLHTMLVRLAYKHTPIFRNHGRNGTVEYGLNSLGILGRLRGDLSSV